MRSRWGMKFYYHVYLTDSDDIDADLLSVGIVAANGLSIYIETNDYDEDRLASGEYNRYGSKDVVDSFLGKTGIQHLIESTKKAKGFICPGFRAKHHINSFLSPYDELAFIGAGSPATMAAMALLMYRENFDKHIHAVKLNEEYIEASAGEYDQIAPELPKKNALRRALFYQYISNSYEATGSPANGD